MSRAVVLPVVLILALAAVPPASAHVGGEPGTAGPWVGYPESQPVFKPRPEPACTNTAAAWRNVTEAHGVPMRPDPHCEPDNPDLIAAFVLGTDKMPAETLDALALHPDAVVKGPDLDGDGDSDVINITLEINELNGWHLVDDDLAETWDIAPGIAPAFWVFSPKSTIHHTGDAFFDVVRPPSPTIRVEVGDEVHIRVENTHYFPHTIHFHGVDHPYHDAAGEGNDGVPHFSEMPILPGKARTYDFTPRVPGTMWYHCHVNPDKHVQLGLAGMFVVVEDRPNNHVQTLNVGGGFVRHPDVATAERYDREYDLVFSDLDLDLSATVQKANDPRAIGRAQNQEYDPTDATQDVFLLNGLTFPYTLRESNVVVAPDEDILLRVLQAGEEVNSLHTHGHKATVVAVDGIPDPAPQTRDVYTLTSAQRIDLWLNTTNDGLHSYGPGVWLMHDHIESHTTTDGISMGGNHNAIVYEEYLDPDTGIPMTHMVLDAFFTADYWAGKTPSWEELGMLNIFGGLPPDDETQTTEKKDAPAPGAASVVAAVVATLVAIAAASRRWRP